MSVFPLAAAASEPVVVPAQLHPNVDQASCGDLPSLQDVSGEQDFVVLLNRGWITLNASDFQGHRQPHPCLQEIAATFPTREAYYDFLTTMSACPQYPFYSGADYHLQTAIFARVAAEGDAEAYRRLLEKDATDCASELNAPLYSILRRNPSAFLQAFGDLPEPRQAIVVAMQYDFNAEVAAQQFPRTVMSTLPVPLQAAAKRFNEALARVAQGQ